MDVDEEIARLDREIEEELKKLTEEERQEVLYIISNGRYGKRKKDAMLASHRREGS